jgi:hypothetical protein
VMLLLPASALPLLTASSRDCRHRRPQPQVLVQSTHK